jgi:hypothetical protein
MHSAWHADKMHIEAAYYALWVKGVELAIVIIVYFLTYERSWIRGIICLWLAIGSDIPLKLESYS